MFSNTWTDEPEHESLVIPGVSMWECHEVRRCLAPAAYRNERELNSVLWEVSFGLSYVSNYSAQYSKWVSMGMS